MQGIFTSLDKIAKKWLLDAHILMYKNWSFIFNAINMERTRAYLTLYTTPLDGTKNINLQISLDYISETQGGLFLTRDSLCGIPSKVYAWCQFIKAIKYAIWIENMT